MKIERYKLIFRARLAMSEGFERGLIIKLNDNPL